ncbi:hypothetical protein [Brevibacillus brevis]|uniref:hypothetical protein n=1 Tax=Brevibacillus brevis TaxID=1393 RepID=UPI0025A55157|nr:hypothetical protein [Brevibacillus brevis]WJQ83768.1 hypothetical protein QN310_11805 [Brevibacillus brevis]
MLSQKKFPVVLTIACLAVFLVSAYSAFAQTYPQRWISYKITSGVGLDLAYNYDYTNPSNYSHSEIESGANKWNNIGANVRLTTACYNCSDVVIREVSSDQWSRNGWSSDFYAWTQQIAGSKACSSNGMSNNCTSNDVVTLAAIYINAGKIPNSSDKRSALIAHELGHAFSIAHNGLIGVDSIMKSGAWNDGRFSYTPTSVDIQDVNSMYSR